MRIVRYGGALATTVAITLLHVFVLQSMLSGRVPPAPYAPWLLGLAFIGWRSGRGPAYFGLVVSVLPAWWFLLTPEGAMRWTAGAQIVAYVCVGGLISYITGSVGDRQQKLQADRDKHLRNTARFETLLEFVPEGVLIAEGPAGQITHISRYALELMGEPYETLATSIGSLAARWKLLNLDGTPAQEDRLQMTRALRAGEVSRQELWRVRRADGTELVCEGNAAPIRSPDGGITGALVTFSDVTSRVELEELLRRHDEELSSVTELAPVAIWFATDPKCEQIIGNSTAKRLYGANQYENFSVTADPGSRQIRQNGRFLKPEELPLRRAAILNQEIPPAEYEIVMEHETRWMLGGACPLRDARGNPRGAVAAFLDVTDLKSAEMQLQTQASELSTALEDFQHFSYAANHDMLEPLRTVSVYSEIMAQRAGYAPKEELRRYARHIQIAAQRARSLSQDLLDYTRATSQPRRDDVVMLNKIVYSVVATLRSTIEECSAVIESTDLPTVLYDTGQMQHVLQNLIANSLKYCSPERPPHIRISAAFDPEQCTISVEDNGIGFDMRYAEKIFAIFQRLQTTESSGSGLGLAICKRIVEQHGGKIWATAAPGTGSKFCFTIPAHRVRSSERSASNRET